MARHIFPGDLHLLPSGGPASNTPFSWYSDLAGGVQYTDILGSDGVSRISLTTDANGLRPAMYGPDAVEVMYVETGVGQRVPVYADDVLRQELDETFLAQVQTALTNAANALTQVANVQAQLNSFIASGGGGGGGTGGTTFTSYSQVTSLLGYPTTFPPSAHGHAQSDVAGLVTALSNLNAALPTKADLVAGKVPSSQLPAASAAPTPSAIGAVQNVAGLGRVWGRTADQGIPTAAEGLQDGDYVFVTGAV